MTKPPHPSMITLRGNMEQRGLTMEQQNKNPVTWCEQMRDKAKTDEEAHHYHQLAEIYRERMKQ